MKVKLLDGTEREVEIAPYADLYGANLYGADLRDANLRGADLRGADLYGADLRGANLRDANLYGADLRDANLRGANLRGADLRGANLRDANLYGADLYGADLRGADLYGADLQLAKGLSQFVVAPPAGQLIGYKKLANGVIATLLIPADAKRVNAYGSRKCRAEFVYVQDGEGVDKHSGKVEYVKGRFIQPDSFDPDPRVECSNGIHFFITREEAEEY